MRLTFAGFAALVVSFFVFIVRLHSESVAPEGALLVVNLEHTAHQLNRNVGALKSKHLTPGLYT